MTTYLHKNFCGLGDRLVVHPRGLPPGWTESNVPAETREKARDKARSLYGQSYTPTPEERRESPRCTLWKLHSNRVYHLNPETLELIETFPLR